jgi:hypothetical protein
MPQPLGDHVEQHDAGDDEQQHRTDIGVIELPDRDQKILPDYTEPPEARYSESGVRYLHAMVVSEPDTPDITGVTFVLAPTSLVTVRYDPAQSFDLFAQKLCKSTGLALFPDAVRLASSTRSSTARQAR